MRLCNTERLARLHRRDNRKVLCGAPACNALIGLVEGRRQILADDDPTHDVILRRRRIALGLGWKREWHGVYVRSNHARKRIARGLAPADRRRRIVVENDDVTERQNVTEIARFPSRVQCDCGTVNVLDFDALRLSR
jgi:hypothetical protein